MDDLTFIEKGQIEILRYVPLELQKDLNNASIDEFFDQLAIARYVQEIESNIICTAVDKLFSEV